MEPELQPEPEPQPELQPEPQPEPRAPLSKEVRAARRARAQKEWARTARAQLSEPQLAATKAAMRALKAGEIETPDFCAAALAVFREVEDEVARARLVRAMEQLLPPKFRALYHRLAAGAVDVAAAAAAAAAEAPGGQAAEIEPGLLLGGWDAVQSAEALRARGVTHILTVGAADMLAPEVADDSSGFVRKLVEANDMPETDLLAHFDACVEFISEGLGGGQVLVHCWAGHSRSVTVLCAYLLRHPRGPEIDAGPGEAVDAVLQHIRSSGQPSACPNDGFMEQLRWFAAMRRGTRRERASAELAYRVFRMECIRREYGTLMLEMLPPELTAAADCADVEAIYRCRGCRQVIFTSDNVLPHSSGVGQAAFSWHRSVFWSSQPLACM